MNQLLLSVFGAVFLIHSITPTGKESVLKCFKHVTMKYFREKMVLLLVWSGNGDTESEWMKEIIKYMIGSVNWSVHLSDENYIPPKFDYFRFRVDRQRAKNIVILLRQDTPDAINKLAKLSRNMLWLARARMLIVMESEGTGGELLKHMWNTKRVLNSVVMAIGRESIRFASVYPIPNKMEVGVLNVWDDGFETERDMFEDKVPDDFQGHLIKMATFYAEPYVMIPEIPGEYTDGIDVRTVLTLRDYFNFRVEFVESPEGENPFVAFVNGTPSGLFGLLIRGEADMMFVGLRNRYDRTSLAEALTSHIEDISIWVVPITFVDNDSFHNVFDVYVWIALVTFLILLMVVFILINRCMTEDGPSLTDCILEVLSNQLFCPPRKKFLKETRVKIFITLMYFYGLHIFCAYDSSLLDMLVQPPVPEYVESPEEAVEIGLMAYLYPSARPAYNRSKHEMWNKILRPSGHVYTIDYRATLTRIAEEKKTFTLMLNNVARYELGKDERSVKVHIIQQRFGTYPISLFVTVGHPFKDIFDRKVLQLVESGIIMYWLSHFLSGYRKMKTSHEGYRLQEPIKLKHIRMILITVAFSWAVSGLVFVCELVFSKISICRLKKKEEFRTKQYSDRLKLNNFTRYSLK